MTTTTEKPTTEKPTTDKQPKQEGGDVAMDSPTATAPAIVIEIALKSTDGDILKAGSDALALSKTISKIFEEKMPEAGDKPIDVEITTPVLTKIIKWCQDNKDEKFTPPKEDPVTMVLVPVDLTQSQRSFFEPMTVADLVELLQASTLLDIESLRGIASQTIASRISGKTPDDIRKLFGLPDDLTEQEKKAIQDENVWSTA